MIDGEKMPGGEKSVGLGADYEFPAIESLIWEDQAVADKLCGLEACRYLSRCLHDGRSVALWVCFRNQGQLQVDMQNAKFNHGAFV